MAEGFQNGEEECFSSASVSFSSSGMWETPVNDELCSELDAIVFYCSASKVMRCVKNEGRESKSYDSHGMFSVEKEKAMDPICLGLLEGSNHHTWRRRQEDDCLMLQWLSNFGCHEKNP